jgi:hypothetical protein
MNRMPAAVEMNVAEGPEAEGARRATAAFGPRIGRARLSPPPRHDEPKSSRAPVRIRPRAEPTRQDGPGTTIVIPDDSLDGVIEPPARLIDAATSPWS